MGLFKRKKKEKKEKKEKKKEKEKEKEHPTKKDSLVEVGKNIGELKANLEDMEKKQVEIEIIAKKSSALLEILKPDFIIKLKNQDVSLNSLKLGVETVKKLLVI